MLVNWKYHDVPGSKRARNVYLDHVMRRYPRAQKAFSKIAGSSFIHGRAL